MLALHIFNCSIDAPDIGQLNAPEDISYNDIESIAEMVIEKVFLFDNVVKEHDEHDSGSGAELNMKKGLDFFVHQLKIPVALAVPSDFKSDYPDFHCLGIPEFVSDLCPPPPKSVCVVYQA